MIIQVAQVIFSERVEDAFIGLRRDTLEDHEFGFRGTVLSFDGLHRSEPRMSLVVLCLLPTAL